MARNVFARDILPRMARLACMAACAGTLALAGASTAAPQQAYAIEASSAASMGAFQLEDGSSRIPLTVNGIGGARSLNITLRATPEDGPDTGLTAAVEFRSELTGRARVAECHTGTDAETGSVTIDIILSSGSEALSDDGDLAVGTLVLSSNLENQRVSIETLRVDTVDETFAILPAATRGIDPAELVINVSEPKKDPAEEQGTDTEDKTSGKDETDDPASGNPGADNKNDPIVDPEPKKTEGIIPGTGDMLLATVGAVAIVAIAVITIGVVIMRRKKDR